MKSSKAVSVGSTLSISVLPWLLWAATGNFLDFYREGGLFMHVVAAAFVIQTFVAVTLGPKVLAGKIAPLALFVAPAMAAVAGIAGTAMGVSSGYDTLKSAPPGMQATMWAQALSIGENTRQFGYMVAACGCLAAVLCCCIAAAARSQARISLLAQVLGGLGAAAGVASVQAGVPTSMHLFAWPTALVGAGLALGGKGWAASGEQPQHEHRSFGIYALLGLLGALACLRLAMMGSAWGTGMASAATAPPDMKPQMLTRALLDWRTAAQGGVLALAIGAASLLVFLIRTRVGWSLWLRAGHYKGLAGLAILALSVFGAHAGVDATRQAYHADLVGTGLAAQLQGLTLPVASGAKAPRQPLVVLTANAVQIDGSKEPLYSQMAAELLDAKLSRDAASPPLGMASACEQDDWKSFLLAVEPHLEAEVLWKASAWFHEQGGCKMHIVLGRTVQDNEPAQVDNNTRATAAAAGVLGSIYERLVDAPRALTVVLTDKAESRLALLVENGRGILKSAAETMGEPAVLDSQAGREKLSSDLRKLAPRGSAWSPEPQPRVHVRLSQGGTAQDLIWASSAVGGRQGKSILWQVAEKAGNGKRLRTVEGRAP